MKTLIRNPGRIRIALIAAIVSWASQVSVRAQCTPEWQQFPGGYPGHHVTAIAADDLGPDGILYAAFGSEIFRFEGSDWTIVNTGMNGPVTVLTVFDEDGAGPTLPVLIAGGNFTTAGGGSANHIARWDGSTWTSLGSGVDNSVAALTVFDDDGTGPHRPALYVGGSFTNAGGVSAKRVAKWSGSAWTSLGSGMNGDVNTLAFFDEDGSGAQAPVLVAGGEFTRAGGNPASFIAKWNGSSWSPLGSGMDNSVFSLAVFDHDGMGPSLPELCAGGWFTNAGGVAVNSVASWNGMSWSALASGLSPSIVFALLVHDDDGAGPHLPALYAGDSYRVAVHKWDGSSWITIAAPWYSPVSALSALTTFDEDGSGPGIKDLYVGGIFEVLPYEGRPSLGKWDGSSWNWLGSGPAGRVRCWGVFDPDAAGPQGSDLYVGGQFRLVAGIPAKVARWNGSTWSALESGWTHLLDAAVLAMAVFDVDGPGPAGAALFMGGHDMPVQAWDGSGWADAGFPHSGDYVLALTVFDEDGTGSALPALYSAGMFSNGILKFDGSTWSTLGSGVSVARALAVYDQDGPGPDPAVLYVGGDFHTAGGQPANYLARWTGSSWLPLASETDGPIHALAVFDEDGVGPNPPALYAGGSFSQAGAAATASVAKWNGSAWSGLAGGVTGTVASLSVFDEDGSGPIPAALYAGGAFTAAGGASANSIARWNGVAWSALDQGLTGSVAAMTVFDQDEAGPRPAGLIVGGDFSLGAEFPVVHMARWLGCGSSVRSFCFGDGTDAACPCGNNGALGHGCDNSSSTGGALLTAEGNPSLTNDTMVLTSAGERPTALSIFLQGNVAIAPVVFGDGLRCAGGTLKRLYTRVAVGGVVVAPSGNEASLSAQSSARGDPFTAGAARFYQVYYRDSNLGFCPDPPGNSWNVSNALSTVWNP